MNNKKKIINYIFIIFAISLYNFIFSENELWGSILGYSQIVFIASTLLTKNGIMKAYKYHFMFMITSFEYPLEIVRGTIQRLYNYRTVEVFGISLSIIILLLITIKLLVEGIKGSVVSPRWNPKIIFPYIVLGGIALIIGLLGATRNDTFRWVINDLSYFVFILCNILILFNLKITENQFREIKLLFLAGILIAPFISLAAPMFGISKIYGGLESLPSIALLFFVPLFSIYFSEFESKVKGIRMIGILAILIIIFLKPSGKELIIIAFIPMLLFYQYAVRNKIRKMLIIAPVLLFVLFVTVMILPNWLRTNQLFMIKFTEAFSLLNLFSWIKDPYQLPPSPRFRVIEFLNIFKANASNVFYIIFGRGFGGYFNFDYYPLQVIGASAFGSDQLSRELFYRPHESLNVIFLKHGLLGVFYWIKILIYMVIKYKFSFFYIVSLIWLFLFYGFSFIYPTIGIVAFFIAEKEKTLINKR